MKRYLVVARDIDQGSQANVLKSAHLFLRDARVSAEEILKDEDGFTGYDEVEIIDLLTMKAIE